MRRLALCLVVCLGSGAVLGCGSSGGSGSADAGADAGINVNAFTGTWVASKHEYTNNADSNETYDVVATGGESRWTVLNGGQARIFLTVNSVEDQWDAALLLLNGTLNTRPVETTRPRRTYDFVLDGDSLTLTDADADFDFTLSGATPVSATVVIEMTRQ